MTRRVTLFVMNNMDDIKKAYDELKSDAHLPEGAVVHVYYWGDENAPEMQVGMIYGDLVQTIDFAYAWQASQYPESEAFADQKRRTRGLFSSYMALNYTAEENRPEPV